MNILRQRKTLRLPGYNYSWSGYYFVTICTHGRQEYFGNISDGHMVSNDAGRMIEKIWGEIPQHYQEIGLDVYQIMPNHLHGIIIITSMASHSDFEKASVGADPCVRPRINPVGVSHCVRPRMNPVGMDPRVHPEINGQAQRLAPTCRQMKLYDVIKCFKTLATKKYIDGVNGHRWRSFEKRLWQRNYYERIIRNECELDEIRKYIVDNPVRWKLDEDNPKKVS